MMKIKTLAQILADTPQTSKGSHENKALKKQPEPAHKKPRAALTSARGFAVSDNNENAHSNHSKLDLNLDSNLDPVTHSSCATEQYTDDYKQKPRTKRRKKTFHPASPYLPKINTDEPIKEVDPNRIKSLLAQVKAESDTDTDLKYNDSNNEQTDSNKTGCDPDQTSGIDNLPEALKAYLKTPEQRQAEKEEIKANSRLRWLAFYYLSRREHSSEELRQKLIDKEQDPAKIDELLAEFAEKGYQSDYRTALMLIREGIRKRHGRVRIKNDFYKRKVEMPTNIDELIDMSMADNEEFADVLSDNELVEGVDWLRLAVEARVKKYGNAIPTEQNHKAKQLRFLQYRGFKPDICFEAIKYNLDNLIDRY